MLVKINGKEVEVGPGRAHKQNCGCLGKLFQKTTQNSGDYSELVINGNKVDMNNPDDVQRALKLCRTVGGIFFGVIAFILLAAVNGIDWANFDFTEDVIAVFFAVSIWFIIAFVFAILVPRSLQKRLDELKKQGKIPSKYGKKLNTVQNSLNQKTDILKTNYPKLMFNGQEVNLDDPRIVQKIASIIQKISFGIILAGFVFVAFDISSAISLILMGLICRIYFLKIVYKYLNELKKQGKIPSKH